ncbi:MAG: hypothetical protein ACLPXB_12735 [Thiobacillaceae bacterium]
MQVKKTAQLGWSLLAVALYAAPLLAQDAAMPDVATLTTRVRQTHPEYATQGVDLNAAVAAFNAKATQFNSDCGSIDPDDKATLQGCQVRLLELQGERARLVARIGSFNTNVKDAIENAPYRPSGNGMVGGTGWIVGYNVPKPTPELIAKSRAMLAEQERLAGHTYADAIDFDHYNFVIGIAADTDFGWDLVKRVVTHDEGTAGQYSIENQPGYAALAGRSFHDLACHSNGAMVCLAALAAKDVKADNVTLYGPQITQQALEQWDSLVRSGQVKSVTLVVNSGDPVPPLSLAFEDYVSSRLEGRQETYANKALLETKELSAAVNETAPRLLVHVYNCSFSVSDPMHCHGMATYKSEGAH